MGINCKHRANEWRCGTCIQWILVIKKNEITPERTPGSKEVSHTDAKNLRRPAFLSSTCGNRFQPPTPSLSSKGRFPVANQGKEGYRENKGEEQQTWGRCKSCSTLDTILTDIPYISKPCNKWKRTEYSFAPVRKKAPETEELEKLIKGLFQAD